MMKPQFGHAFAACAGFGAPQFGQNFPVLTEPQEQVQLAPCGACA